LVREETQQPDQVFIIRFWREDRCTWRVQVSNENKSILGWAEGVEQSLELLRPLLKFPRRN
jgi:hypothetical protein